MPLETTAFERTVHLLLFIVGGLAFAVGALALLERATGSQRTVVRWSHVAVAGGAFVLLGGIELVFHLTR